MSTKTVVTKKKKDQQPENGKADPQTDVRVAQQRRVLEVVGAGKGDKDDKKYSPRTETHIRQLSDLLDCFQYSRADIAALVRRCHHDDQQIQVAVANIIEDRANHGMENWGEVKSKKQLKEEKKAKEEEEKREQEQIEKELEKQRKEADRRAKKEAEKQRAQRGDSRGDSAGYDEAAGVDGSSVALPPDPAILFAGPKPVASQEPEKARDDWWDGVQSSYWDWGGKDTGSKSQGGNDTNWEDWEDWSWKGRSWDKGEWATEDKGGGSRRADEGWWQEGWNGQAGSGGGEAGKARARGKKAPKERKAGASKEKQQPQPQQQKGGSDTEIWDMPDVNASANEGGLDQWTLGDIRAHDAEASKDAEHQQLAAGASAAPPAGGKSQIEMLLGGAAEEVGFDEGADRAAANERPERGRGRGKGGRGRGGERVEKTDRVDRGDRGSRGEAGGAGGHKGGGADGEGEKERIERLDRSDDPRRQPMEEVGENATVRKHSSMGCAVVTMKDTRVRDAILRLGNEVVISGIKVQMKPHTDKETKAEIPTDIFVAWGRQVEKMSPLSEREVTKFFDAKHRETVASWQAEAEEKARQVEEQARQQRLLEEQQRQQADLREREEQRRRYEEDLARRQQHEADQQRTLAEEQRRQEEQRRIQHEAQAKWTNTLQGDWSGARAGATHDPRSGLSAASLHGGTVGQAATAQPHGDPMSNASAAGLNPSAAAYQNGQLAAAAQWSVAQQWMQAMAYQSQQQGWQQQLAQRAGMQQMPGMAQMGAQQMAPQQGYDQLRQQAACYAYLSEQQRQQQHGQSATQAYSQQGYPGMGQHSGAQFSYGSAAYGGRGERM